MMSKAASLSALFLYALASFGTVSGMPALSSSADFPEVIPGPGMPSLKSLGLTSADLYLGNSMTSKRVPTGLEPQFTFTCNDNGGGRVPVSNAQACITYLHNLGHTQCRVTETVTFCSSGPAAVYGSNIGSGVASSYCVDVATGGQQIINDCNEGGQVAGANAANGNGNLIVAIEKNM